MSLSPAQWSSVQNTLKTHMAEDDFNTWISTLQPAASRDADTIALSVPTQFMQDWISQHFGTLIASSVAETLQKPVGIEYIVTPVMAELGTTKTPLFQDKPISPVPTPATQAPAPLTAPQPTLQLDTRFTFDNFVVGKSNEFAFAAAKRIAENLDSTYNPFFLHGDVGLGKTHLIQAMAKDVQTRFPAKTILYLSAEQFLSRYVNALRQRNTSEFKQFVRGVDLLIIDDIQFIAGKDNTQEEFFHTFNDLMGAGKHIILTADRSPHDLVNVEDRLKSRLGSGLTCQIHKPAIETRIAILENKAEHLGLDLKPDVAMYLADGIRSNVRELEGALNRLAAHASMTGAAITIPFAQSQLQDLLRANTRTVTIDDIQQKVCDHFNVRLVELLGTRRLRQVARPRQVAMYLAKKYTNRSYPDIGRAFGGRDHTTVIHAVRTVENLLPRDKELAEKTQLLESILGGGA